MNKDSTDPIDGDEINQASPIDTKKKPGFSPTLIGSQALVPGVGATIAGLGLTGTVTASSASAFTTGVGAALMAPIAGLSIGVPVVAPVVVGIALLVYLLVKKNQSNKELYEVMS